MYNALLEFSSLASIDSFDWAHSLGICENSERKTLFSPNFWNMIMTTFILLDYFVFVTCLPKLNTNITNQTNDAIEHKCDTKKYMQKGEILKVW